MSDKPNVFVIIPFDEEFLALYDELKKTFKDDFTFNYAGDLDNQQNILQDIVEGIYHADVIIADLTGLNANVFYELGLAHAMNKKVIIITRDLGELPFDIKSYRANEYSPLFYKLPEFIEELKKLLFGAINNSVKYGNPVSDYAPDFYTYGNGEQQKNISERKANGVEMDNQSPIEEADDKGFIDFIADIEDNSEKMSEEISSMGNEMNEMTASVNSASNEISRVKSQSGNVNASFVKNICRKLSEPVDEFAGKLKTHVRNIYEYWNVVENSYLSLLDNPFAQNDNNIQSFDESMNELMELQNAVSDSNVKIEAFISALRGNLGMERRLNKSISSLIEELQEYLQVTEMIVSSIDRIRSKSEIVISTSRKITQ